MRNISKKESSVKEFLKQFWNIRTLFGIILYFVIAGIIGCFVTDYQSIILRFIKGIEYGFLIIFGILIIDIIEFVTYIINKIKAIKRYTYLPLTVEDIKQSIKNGLFSTKESYIKYICDQLRYESIWGLLNCNSIKLTNIDLVLLCKSVEEVYKSPIVFTYEEFYKYFKKYKGASPFEYKGISPFEFKTEEYLINPKYVEIFCTDMNLAEEVVKDTDLEYTIYNVEKND